MQTLNDFVIVGELLQELEMDETSNGIQCGWLHVRTFRESGKGKFYKKTEHYHRIRVWGKLLPKLTMLPSSGIVEVSGYIDSRLFEYDGEPRYKSNLTADRVNLIKESQVYDVICTRTGEM
jgi:single-stranded DNA-binding protein